MRNLKCVEIRAYLETVPKDAPVSLRGHSGGHDFFGMRLALRAPATAVHMAWLSTIAIEARHRQIEVRLMGSGDAGPFGQFATATGSTELFLLAKQPECLLSFVERERLFNPAVFDTDGFLIATSDSAV